MKKIHITTESSIDVVLSEDVAITIADNACIKILVRYNYNQKGNKLQGTIGKNAKVFLIEYIERNSETDVQSAHSVNEIIIDEGAELHWVSIYKNSGAHREQKVVLQGDRAKATQYSMIIDNEKNTYDITAISEHEGKFTYSLIHERGALRESFVTFRGLIKINKDASGSSGYQRSDVLLLGEHAKIHTIPDLEIQNDDVRCTHGSSITHPDNEKMFYLTSRGVSECDAEQLLVDGFYEALIAQIPEVHERVRELIIQ